MSSKQPLSREQLARFMAQMEDTWSTVGEEVKTVASLGAPGQSPVASPPGGALISRPTRIVARVRPKVKPVPQKRKPRGGASWRKINAGHVADYGWKAYQMAKQLWTLMNVEEKIFDVDGSAGTEIKSTATVVNLSNIAQGSDYFNRIGDSILGQMVEFRASVTSNAAASGHRMRVLIVCDKLQRGSDPVIGDVLQGGTDPMTQPYVEPQEGRFDVLYDHVMGIYSGGAGLATSGTSTAYIPAQAVLPSLIRKWNKHIKYQGTSGADASNWVNGLFLMAISGSSADGPTLRYTFRLRFTDN